MQVLVCTVLMGCITNYNSIIDLVSMLPFKPDADRLSGTEPMALQKLSTSPPITILSKT